jgi:hypothetical protein
MKPLALDQIAKIKAYITTSLPFKVPERMAELERIEKQLEANNLEPEQSVAQLWSMVEDELRLTRESGLYRQTIVLDGEELIADVARIGMVLMYFQPSDGQVGMVMRNETNWEYRLVTDREDRKRILYLFDSLNKHIREGYFELPNPL